jgi:hypothetical protein
VIIKFLDHIAEQEKHFNNLETEYRKLASTWLLAAVGACGYILANKDIPFDTWTMVSGIGVIASIGIFVLYVMDLNVYHKLLDAYFIEGLRLEAEHYEWLRPVRIRMYKSQKLSGITGRVMFYYFISITLLMSISVFGVWHSDKLNKAWCLWILSSITLIGLIVLFLAMRCFAKNDEAQQYVDEYEMKTNTVDPNKKIKKERIPPRFLVGKWYYNVIDFIFCRKNQK